MSAVRVRTVLPSGVAAMRQNHALGRRRPGCPAVVVPGAGVLLGVLDFVWIKYVPFPFGGLGNSIAVWAVVAFLLAFLNRWTLPAGIVGSVLCLVLAVPSYYLAATVIQSDSPENMYNATALLWMALGVVAGTVFGAAGVLARTAGRLRAAAAAMPGAVLFAEAAMQLKRMTDPSYTTSDSLGYAAVLIASGLALVVLVSRADAGITGLGEVMHHRIRPAAALSAGSAARVAR
ncbi:hypothetical protein Aph02nite_38250 [Actinoplanes philippinensis]|uniref:Uncharacterized protein n=1 Tax=Actinoplanes philippinensis TaxID=35752 RepID=A0A1I2FLT4_9ACTN|nr:DUF6518 family protein [Actinoplanes philippinensis]GIE77875.1 hypothetical protein Aph02nite_38250 [Actinoplanes philippinensis]SFF06265.1 hypothetical protein SAMN05421541_105511 [Actinoplanes philippinensis]